ncbi:MAG: TetR/AcrR family transcriptional regulator C-terminal domain-containing protein [Nocardioidaceae bacterium]
MPLTRDAIVAAALELLRAEGLEGLTLRRLAADLGVSAPTLYWHLDNKRHLMDLVADALLAELGPVDVGRAKNQPWWRWLRQRSVSMFEALVATRDGPRVLAGNRPSPQTWPEIDQVLGRLVGVGFTPAQAQQSLFAIGAYVIGSAVEWQAEAARATEGPPDDIGAAIDDGRFPHLASSIRAIAAEPPEATFAYGLDLLIDGMRARLARPAGSAGGHSTASPADAGLDEVVDLAVEHR